MNICLRTGLPLQIIAKITMPMTDVTNKFPTPSSASELLDRAQQLAGMTLAEAAELAKVKVPNSLVKEKGWIGLLLETLLGADAGTKAEPDFTELGIELKTLPISHTGKPLETTFVSVAPLTGINGETWHSSHIYRKLKRVLWVPIIADKTLAIAERTIATSFLWTPSPKEEQLLKQDWQELTDMIALGQVEQINGRIGQVLQLRPKAANSHVKTQAFDQHGRPFMTLPRGFYLKTQFTQQLLNAHLRID